MKKEKKLYKKVFVSGDYVFAADIVSMYPTCMMGVEGLLDVEYPLSQCHMSENPEKEFKDSKLVFYEIEFIPPKDLLHPKIPY